MKLSTTTAALLLAVASAVSGCAGGGAASVAAGKGYTPDQLRKALLTDVSGYRKAAEPDSGQYGSLRAIQNFNQLQRQVKLDKPQCVSVATATAPSDLKDAAAAIATFAKDDGQTLTETLVAVPSSVADEQVKTRVPTGCRSFRAQVGDQWSTHEVTEATTGRQIGDGSRTVGVTTVSGSMQVQTWYVVLRSRGYLATVTLYGPSVTQDEVERMAQQAYDQAQKALV